MTDEQLTIFSGLEQGASANQGHPVIEPPTAKDAGSKEGLVPCPERAGATAREITPHSLIKQERVFRYANTVATAMAKKWQIWWIDLFAGPGMVVDRTSGEFREAIPLQVVNGLRRPFAGYVFSDLSDTCVSSLRKLLNEDVAIEGGDANDQDYLDTLLGPIPRNALVLAYLDPEGLDLHFETIRFLANRFRSLDLLLNMPVHAIDRAISAGACDPVKKVLEHPEPQELLDGRRTGQRIRQWFIQKMKELGYQPDCIVGNEIRSSGNKTPQYDLILASKSPIAVKLYRKANQVDADGQRTLDIAI